jgi:GAF domain-containing protein
MLPDYRVRQRDYLLEISRALTSRLNLNEVLRLILQQAAEILNGHAALIALVEPDNRYTIRQSYGIPQPLLDQLQPLLNQLEDVGEAVTALERNLIAIARAVGLGLWQVVSLPLKIEGEEFLGALYVFRVRGGGLAATTGAYCKASPTKPPSLSTTRGSMSSSATRRAGSTPSWSSAPMAW